MTLLGLLLFGLSVSSASGAVAVVGYLPEWRYHAVHWPTLARGYTHLILFSAEPTAVGGITGLDRLPAADLLAEARAATRATGAKLMVCFGGNGRSGGFKAMTRNAKARRAFITAAVKLVADMQLDGIDLNWEYPGFEFGKGYASDSELSRDWSGLAALSHGLRAKLPSRAVLSAAYYPDGKQERMIVQHNLTRSVALFHAMSYDANGAAGHSPMSLAQTALGNARAAGLPLALVTIGLPFYGRALDGAGAGDWTTYEDIVQRHHPLPPGQDVVTAREGGARIAFNGRDTIAAKTRLALDSGLGGVMVWEAGQDCRLVEVVRGKDKHVVTCPSGRESSLLAAIQDVLAERAVGGGGGDAAAKEEEEL